MVKLLVEKGYFWCKTRSDRKLFFRYCIAAIITTSAITAVITAPTIATVITAPAIV